MKTNTNPVNPTNVASLKAEAQHLLEGEATNGKVDKFVQIGQIVSNLMAENPNTTNISIGFKTLSKLKLLTRKMAVEGTHEFEQFSEVLCEVFGLGVTTYLDAFVFLYLDNLNPVTPFKAVAEINAKLQ